MSAYSLIDYCFFLILTNLIYGKLYLMAASICTFLTTPEVEYLLYIVYSIFFIGLFPAQCKICSVALLGIKLKMKSGLSDS